jgi:ribosomal protein S11
VRVSGPGSGRESAVRALSTAGIEVRAIKDRHADSAQRLPSAQKAESLIRAATVRERSK